MIANETERCPECHHRKTGLWARVRRVRWKPVIVTAFGFWWTGFVAWLGLGRGGVIFACPGIAFVYIGAYVLGLTSARRRRS